MSVLGLKSVEDTHLWKRLHSWRGQNMKVAQTLAANLAAICEEASDRMKAMPTLMPEFTLHDEVHGLRVAELMWRIMPASVRGKLNPVEIALLILAAFLHDQGMVLEVSETANLKDDPAFQTFAQNWELDHPNVRMNKRRLGNPNLSAADRERAIEMDQELHGAMLTDYIRQSHGERSAAWIRQRYGTDRRLTVSETNIAEFAARLALSHVAPADMLSERNGFRIDERVATWPVNMQYLGVVLRLADIMDLDRERTPDSLYRTINFRSHVSLREWAKHRSVDGWVIEPNVVQFTIRCEHPEYQRAANQFMDWIDHEIVDAYRIVNAFPDSASAYKLELPLRVDRSRIEPKDNAYIYYDLEFSLSRDEIVSLLMMDKLYGGPWLAVRELLQNALDAIRLRHALMKRDRVEWTEGKVAFEHFLDTDGHEILRCTDNGVGMDEEIVRRFLTRAGRSYYRSPEFDRERAGLRAAGADFDPCARFGIGFMSCFMIGDDITVRTRRDRGPSVGHGDPLVVEINGVGGMLVVRRGDPSQPVGTTVEIRRREPSLTIDEWNDDVLLVATLAGYAIATEYAIEGSCALPGLERQISIPPHLAEPRTELEKLELENVVTLTERFEDIDPNLRGFIKASFVAESSGRLVDRIADFGWAQQESFGNPRNWRLMCGDKEVDSGHYHSQIAVDGILVAGRPGRADVDFDSVMMLGEHAPQIGFGRCLYVLDVRGSLKPALTPARFAPDVRFRSTPEAKTWRRVEQAGSRAWGRMWERIAAHTPDRLDFETFWFLVEAYNGGVLDMRANALWSRVQVPIERDGVFSLFNLHQIGPMTVRRNEHEIELMAEQGIVRTRYSTASNHLFAAVLACCALHRAGNRNVFMTSDFSRSSRLIREPITFQQFEGGIYRIPFHGELADFVTADAGARVLNAKHPLISAADLTPDNHAPDAQRFLSTFAFFISHPEVLRWLAGDKPPERWAKLVAALYERVESDLDPPLKPPYKVMLASGETSTISASDFANWKKGKR
jgi:hypothetical protein